MTAFVPSPADAATLAVSLAAVFPWFDLERSTLGGEHRAALMVRVSLDARETWENGILHNSRYSMFRVNSDGVEQFARNYNVPKMRKAKAADVAAAFAKIAAWAAKV
jgi:hypothetical protein